jgi:hypothetical protein
MTHDDLTPLGTALDDRVRDEHPDLDRLISASTRAGYQMRRRRTIGASVAAVVAGVTMIGVVGAVMGGSGGPSDSDPGFATQPTTSASTSAHTGTPEDVVPPTAPLGQALPVHVDPALTGWVIGAAGDEKFPASKGDHFLSVHVRPRSQYDAWSGGDPDRSANQVVHVGDNYFVTVQPSSDVPPEVVDELVAALTFDPVWNQ